MDFLGTTQNTEFIGNVVAGVQATAPGIFPFFVFLGIVLTFVIARFIISLIMGMFDYGNADVAGINEVDYIYSTYDKETADRIFDIAEKNELSFEQAEQVHLMGNKNT